LFQKKTFERRALEGNVESMIFLKTYGNKNITAYVGFIDLYNFSTIVKGKSPQEIGDYLNPFLTKTIDIICNRSALVDKMIGDEIMFILPEHEEDKYAPHILFLGQIMGALHDLAFELEPKYRFRIGLSYGKVNVYHLKGKGYSEWSIIGEPVHIAKRLLGVEKLIDPNPVCGAFGLSINGKSFHDPKKILKARLGIIAGFASRFTHEIMPETKLKGVGNVNWAYLYPKKAGGIIMTTEELWQEWEEHYSKLGIDKKRICRDGIINMEAYSTASMKILFIMRDVNKWEGGDLREMLKNGPKYQMWHVVARWTAGILNNFPPFTDIDNYETMKDAIIKIATINLKKASGGPSSNMSVINAYAFQDCSLLREQIEAINPNIVMACGTFDILIWLLELKVNPDEPNSDPVYDEQRKIWVVPFRHPARVNNESTYSELNSIFNKLSIPK